jgi:mono/diheme cytochrome c family protein
MSSEIKSNPASGEPSATRATVPMWIIVLLLVLLFLGGVYFDHHSGWFNARVYVPYVSAAELNSYQPKSGAAAELAHGKQVYDRVCGICHGPDGRGKPNQAPPLAGSEWVNAKGVTRLIHIPQTGLSGAVEVEGKQWNLNMAPMGAALHAADLAAVLTYIRSAWGNKAGEVTPAEVKSVRAALGAHPQPLTGAELKTLPE